MNKLLNLSILQISLLLVLANVLVYGQVIGFEFVNFKDTFYVENSHVKNGLIWEGLVWAFSHKYNLSQSLNWISHMIDVELFGLNPAGHHAVSLFLHSVNTVIFFLFMNKFYRLSRASQRKIFETKKFCHEILGILVWIWCQYFCSGCQF